MLTSQEFMDVPKFKILGLSKETRLTADKLHISSCNGDVILGDDRVFSEGLGSRLACEQLCFNDMR